MTIATYSIIKDGAVVAKCELDSRTTIKEVEELVSSLEKQGCEFQIDEWLTANIASLR